MHKLFFDCETTGLDCKAHSLLTAYFGIYDKDLKLIDDLYLEMKPGDVSNILVEPKAMEVTGINLADHLANPNTVTYEVAKDRLVKFLEKNKIPKKRKSFQPAGHNIQFDKNFIWNQLLPEDEWRKLCHHTSLDTLHVVTFLKDVGILPTDVGKLTSLVEYFGIPMRVAHNAKDDIEMNVEVYRCIRDLMQGFKKNSANQVSNVDLLKIIEM